MRPGASFTSLGTASYTESQQYWSVSISILFKFKFAFYLDSLQIRRQRLRAHPIRLTEISLRAL